MVRRIGRRHSNCARHPVPEQVRPVRVRRDAIAAGRPSRDLLLSPDHALYLDGVLIPVRLLINGVSIVSETACREIDYFHLELDRHDVVWANGAAAESYLDTNGRMNFANGGGAVSLHPDFTAWRWETAGCAPLVVVAPRLEAVRRRLNARLATAREPSLGSFAQR
jgi:hypothetical protein